MNSNRISPVTRKIANVDPFFGTLLNDFFNTNSTRVLGNDHITNAPKINLIQLEDGGFHLSIAAAGLGKEDFNITVENQLLKVEGKRDFNLPEGAKFIRKGFSNIQFEKKFNLNDKVNTEAIKATFKNGILTLEIPLKEEAKKLPARKIEIV